MKRSLLGLVLVFVLSCLSATLVGAQASGLTTVTYRGQTYSMFQDRPVIFPGDTTVAAPGLLKSNIPFSVHAYADVSDLISGKPELGKDDAVCVTKTTSTECTMSIIGSNTATLLVIDFTPVAGWVTTIDYNGTRVVQMYDYNWIITSGVTTTGEIIESNESFYYETYNDWGRVASNAVISEVGSTCSTLFGTKCQAEVSGTTKDYSLKIVWGVLPSSAVPTVAAPVTTPAPAGALIIPTAMPTASAPVAPTAIAPASTPVLAAGSPLLSTVIQPGWSVGYYSGTTAQMKNWTFPKMDVASWATFPNVDNPSVGFLVAASGLEYAEDETQTCGSIDDLCNITVAPESYMLITGDYSLDNGIGTCKANNGRGCALVIFNVGSVSSNFKGILDNAFIVQGRYWNGDAIPVAASAVMSHASNNMTNQPSALNPAGVQNAGGNCSSANACPETENQVRVVSGNEVVLAAWTVFKR